jgi:hypothetical protein
MKLIVLALIAFVCSFSNLNPAQALSEKESCRIQKENAELKSKLSFLNMLESKGQLKIDVTASTSDCRPGGYACKHSGECCGFCRDGVCSSSSSDPSCRPGGASCNHSGECCGFCRDGTCSSSSSDPSCRGPGLACDHSGECCGFCRDGQCS